jgi:hypothetical protein
MKRSGVRRSVSLAVALVLLATVPVLSLVGCGGQSTVERLVNTVPKIEQKAFDAVNSANLRMIDSAIQMYYAENGQWPADMNQLTPYFGGKIPVDPSGRTYYITMVNGEAKAAVR